MKVWKKPVLSVLGISKTNSSGVSILSGVPFFSDESDGVPPSKYKRNTRGGPSDGPSIPSDASGSDGASIPSVGDFSD